MLTHILLLNPVYVTLFWIIVLNFYPRKGNEPKRFLGKFMIVAFVVYISHLFFFLGMHSVYIWIDSFYNFASLAVFPIYYIYGLLLVRDRKFSWRLHGKYMIAPAAIFLLIAVGYINMDDETQINYVTLVQHGIASPGKGIGYMQVIAFLAKIVFVVQVIVYLGLAYKLIGRHNAEIAEYYSEPESRSLRWVQTFSLSFFLVSAASAVVALIGRENFQGNDLYLLAPSLVFSLLLFTIGLLGNRQRAVHIIVPEANGGQVTEETIPARLKENLVELFEKGKIYLDKDLKIWDVSGQLGTNRTYVSRIINKDFGQNFSAFVNGYRVAHAKALLSSRKNYSVDEIADLSGFGSVNSLYRAFIYVEKVSLREYRNTIKHTGSF